MADLDETKASHPVKIFGTDTNGAETNPMGVSANSEGRANDCVNNGGLDITIALTTTAVEGKVGAFRKTDRKYIWMQGITVPSGVSQWLLWGFSSTTQNFKLFKDQLLCFPIGDGTEIWIKTPTGVGSVAFGEGS